MISRRTGLAETRMFGRAHSKSLGSEVAVSLTGLNFLICKLRVLEIHDMMAMVLTQAGEGPAFIFSGTCARSPCPQMLLGLTLGFSDGQGACLEEGKPSLADGDIVV